MSPATERAAAPAAGQPVPPQVIAEVSQLIDAVAGELQASPDVEPRLCRIDAITMIIEEGSARGLSVGGPLLQWLLEERRKMSASVPGASMAAAAKPFDGDRHGE